MTEKQYFRPLVFLSGVTSVMVSIATRNIFWGFASFFGLWFIAFIISAAAQRIISTLRIVAE